MLKISKNQVYDQLSKDVDAAAQCASGDIVVFETKDCYDDQVTDEKDPSGGGESGLGNPATGPLYVKEAAPGDVLKVEILNMDLRSWGVMRSSATAGSFPHLFQKKEARIFKIQENMIYFDEHTKLLADPMIGVIGTAPRGEGIPTSTPGKHGGNMDCKRIKKGSILYLPVEVNGALLSMGDLHALMGDGEVMICGLETAGEVTVRVTVLKKQDLKIAGMPLPFLFEGGQVMTIQSAESLDEAGKNGVNLMQQFVKEACGLDDLDSAMLMSLQADMAVCQIVDPLLTMRVEFPLKTLEGYGYKLP